MTSRTSCSSVPRAMDFSSELADFPSKTVEACATIKTSEEVTDPICSDFGKYVTFKLVWSILQYLLGRMS